MKSRIFRPISLLIKTLYEKGVKKTAYIVWKRFFGVGSSPLSCIDKGILFSQLDGKNQKKSKTAELGGVFSDISNLEASFPLVFERNGKILRYSFLEADTDSKGLVVLFHGWGGEYSSGLRPQGWDGFDLLAPWDTFGHNRRGSWFWGEHGDNFVELLVASLVAEYRIKKPGKPLFCFGYSMGGFGALYHGIKYGADGIYVMMPQIDLKRKADEYASTTTQNPYGHLFDEASKKIPDLLKIAEEQVELPPLFLIQNQYDAVNPFAHHAMKLIDVYNQKNGWYGIRIYPALGHTHDGSPEEANVFFSEIIANDFPKKMKDH